jgi:hypothetical protein
MEGPGLFIPGFSSLCIPVLAGLHLMEEISMKFSKITAAMFLAAVATWGSVLSAGAAASDAMVKNLSSVPWKLMLDEDFPMGTSIAVYRRDTINKNRPTAALQDTSKAGGFLLLNPGDWCFMTVVKPDKNLNQVHFRLVKPDAVLPYQYKAFIGEMANILDAEKNKIFSKYTTGRAYLSKSDGKPGSPIFSGDTLGIITDVDGGTLLIKNDPSTAPPAK